MNKHSVLLVDDEAYILSSLKKIIEDDTTEVFTAGDADAATKVLWENANAIEVIVCDNKLPGTLGVDFLDRIRRQYPDIIRILITGYPELQGAIEAINKAHIWKYMTKPIEVSELKLLIKQAFSRYQILKENRFLLKLFHQQAEWLKILKEKYPQIVAQELEKNLIYWVDEKFISELIDEVSKRYFREDISNV